MSDEPDYETMPTIFLCERTALEKFLAKYWPEYLGQNAWPAFNEMRAQIPSLRAIEAAAREYLIAGSRQDELYHETVTDLERVTACDNYCKAKEALREALGTGK